MFSEFLRGKSPAHLVMLAAIVLLFVSYFFQYGDGSDGSASMVIGPDFNWSAVFPSFGGPADGNGWQLNPQGWLIIVVLAFAFLRSDIYEHPLMQRFGWWAALVLVAVCNFNSDGVRALGSSLGMVAFVLALVAAIMHQLARRKVARP